MPGPSAVSNLIEFFYRDGFSRIHEIQMEHSQKYGKIFKSRFGPQLVVSIAGRGSGCQVLRTEGVAPQRGNMESWKEYRPEGPIYRTLSQEGEDWLKMRRHPPGQLIMRPKDGLSFSDDVNAVVEDLVKRVDTLRSQQSDGLTVLNINDLFFKYAMEGMAAILYEDRLGCLENEIPQKSQDYIAALHLMFSSFKMTMYAGPWQEFCSSWDGLFSFSTQIHADKRLGDPGSGVPRRLVMLTHMLVTREMNLEEIYANMTEMLLAGVDTTSFTLSWACLLARHPEVSRRSTRGDEDSGTRDHPHRLVKETLRMFPVLPGNGRVTQDDLVVGGYFIPKGVRVCLYPTQEFPGLMTSVQTAGSGRTLRTGWIISLHPVRHGIRSCIGRRIAELEMHLALTQLVQRFQIGLCPVTEEIKAKTHGLLCPAAPINLQFADRQP
uniref:Uncharacterized protein n=1 Tax=Oncorhynchus tshawytscha TaxID=74940 RepID=A0AAZ3Q373_ONCTS